MPDAISLSRPGLPRQRSVFLLLAVVALKHRSPARTALSSNPTPLHFASGSFEALQQMKHRPKGKCCKHERFSTDFGSRLDWVSGHDCRRFAPACRPTADGWPVPHATRISRPTKTNRFLKAQTLNERIPRSCLKPVRQHEQKQRNTHSKFKGFPAEDDSRRPRAEQTAFAIDTRHSQPIFPAPRLRSGQAGSALEQDRRLL
jgi:hypothetical protein